MKRGMSTLALAVSIFFISCTKDDLETDLVEQTAMASPAPNFVSGWESAPTWQNALSNGLSVFSYKRNIPQLTRDILAKGAVVVWTRGYDIEGSTKTDKPLGIPFTWIPADERYMHPYTWFYSSSENEVAVGVEMHPQMTDLFQAAKGNVKLRYFLITPEFMAANHLTRPALRSMSYDKLIALLNVAP
jgi:hypothetical protein